MFVLYGVRSKGKVIGTTKASESCMNCGKTSKWSIIKEKFFIHVFFIPLIPIKTKYRCECPHCTWWNYIEKREAKEILEILS